MAETTLNTLMQDDDDEASPGLAPQPESPAAPAAAPAPAAATGKKGNGGGNKKATAPAAPAAKAAAPVAKAPAAEKRVTIIIEENDNIPPTGLFVSSNGRPFLIRAGENVNVPLEVLEVLNDAVESTPKTDASGNVVDYRNRLRFPYRIVAA